MKNSHRSVFHHCRSFCKCVRAPQREREREGEREWRASEVVKLPHCFLSCQTLLWASLEWISIIILKDFFFLGHILLNVPLSPSNSPSQCVWLRLLIMSLVPFLFPCVWFWQIHGLSARGIFKYMANVSFHACALICWVFKTNLKDGRIRRGQAFFFLRPVLEKGEGARLWEGDGAKMEVRRGKLEKDNNFPSI